MKHKFDIYINGNHKLTLWDLPTAIRVFHVFCETKKDKYVIDLIDGRTGEILDSSNYVVF